MNKLIEKFIKFVLILSIAFFGIILYSALFKIDASKYLNNVFDNAYIIYWLASILLLAFFIVIHRIIKKIDSKKIKYVILLETVLLIVGQIFIIKMFDPVQVTDSFLINDQATSIAENIDNQVDYSYSSYFKKYSNNNFCLLLTTYLIKFFKLVNFNNYALGLTIFNAIMIDFSILICYLIFRKIKNEKVATEALTINILNPLNYLMIHWTYTCTYSIPFMLLIVYLAILLKDSLSKKFLTAIYSGLFALCLVIAYLLRPIIVIPIIAIVIYLFIFIIQNKIRIRQCILPFVILVLISFLSFSGINYKIKEYIPDSSNTFPVTHWIMMGLHGKGTVNSEDNSFTASYETREEKKKANIDEIKRTLKEYKISGLVNHLLVKLPITWDNGSSDYYLRIYQDKNQNSAYRYLIDGKNDLILIYCQSFRIVTLFLALLSLVNQLKKPKLDFLFFNSLLIFGAVLFYLIWEAKSAYSIPFLPFLFVLTQSGLTVFDEKFTEKLSHNNLKKFFIIVFAISVTLSVSLYKPFARNRFHFNYYSVNVTNTGSSNFIDKISEDDIEIKQEFHSIRKFNKILLYAKKINDSDTKYDVKVRDAKNNILEKYTIDSTMIDQSYITLYVDINKTEANCKYTIEISSNNDDSNVDSIKFGYVYSKVIETYDGQMYLNGEETTDKLFIKVYDKKKTTYMGKIMYIIISSGILLFEFLLYKFFKKDNSITNSLKRKSRNRKRYT